MRGTAREAPVVIFPYGFYRKFIRIGQSHGFGGHKPHPQAFGVLNAAALQLRTGNRLSKAVVVFDLLGPVQRTGALGQHGGVHPRAAGTYDHNVGHGWSSFSESRFKMASASLWP